MYIAILGRQPELGRTELECLYGRQAVSSVRPDVAHINSSSLDFNRLGGIQKAGKIVAEFPKSNWISVSKKIIHYYVEQWKHADHKITLGVSVYGTHITPRDIQRTGIHIKKALKVHDTSVRLVPNDDSALSSATSHHNKLGLSPNKVELLVIYTTDGRVLIAESIGAQNITAFASRDQERPKRDAFVGMLPPKLARMMVNMSGIAPSTDLPLLLDPFCGTGVVLQEALVQGFSVAGTDLSDKMVDYTSVNLEWITQKMSIDDSHIRTIRQGDAMEHSWRDLGDINAVVCESYLGQPFSAPPSPAKLKEVVGNCNHIISSFLTNIAKQLPTGTPLVIAVPAWRDARGDFTHLPLTRNVEKLGLTRRTISHNTPLLYYRENQVVAREILLLKTA